MERSTVVRVHEGLHARPATRFVKLAKSFECDVELVRGTRSASAKSSVKLMLLGVKENDEVTVRTDGADAIEALETLIGYLENPLAGLDEEAKPIEVYPPLDGEGRREAAGRGDGRPHPLADARDLPHQGGGKPSSAQSSAGETKDETGALRGVAASEGLALGPVFAHFPPEIRAERRRLDAAGIETEFERLNAAMAAVQARMNASLGAPDLSANDRGIIAALRDIANDDSLREAALGSVRGGLDAVSATIGAAEQIAADFGHVDDVYLNARADDVRAVGRQICLALLGQDDVRLDEIPDGAILVADDIGAFDLARAPLKRIGGVVCGHGGATSHIAIIARAHGIPAVLGLGDAVHRLRDARHAALDGHRGRVFAEPDESVQAEFRAGMATAALEREALKSFRDVTPRRADGTVIEVAANLGSLEEIDAAKEAGAMGVGLFRTELLFMRHMHLPSEDMQAETYAALARAFAPYPVIVRTLDIGGDKPVAGIDFPQEENPFLGWRGIRMCLDRPDVFKPQLRALLRAAVAGNVKVMLPMVADIDEVRRTRALVEECKTELQAEGKAFGDFALGVMIETPAAVLIAPALAKECAFFSIGTNDLTQYIMAADRLNPTVARLNDVRNVAVMAAIEMTARAGVAAGIMVGMCGEAAGLPDLIPEFLRMGLTELSMSPASIGRAKKAISGLA